MLAAPVLRAKKEEKPKNEPKPGLPADQEKKLRDQVAQANHNSTNRPR